MAFALAVLVMPSFSSTPCISCLMAVSVICPSTCTQYVLGLLNFGLLILSFNFFKKNKLGVLIIILATLIIYFGRFIPHRLIYGYALTAIGFSMLFYQTKSNDEY
jgi:hypothetical protein